MRSRSHLPRAPHFFSRSTRSGVDVPPFGSTSATTLQLCAFDRSAFPSMHLCRSQRVPRLKHTGDAFTYALPSELQAAPCRDLRLLKQPDEKGLERHEHVSFAGRRNIDVMSWSHAANARVRTWLLPGRQLTRYRASLSNFACLQSQISPASMRTRPPCVSGSTRYPKVGLRRPSKVQVAWADLRKMAV